MLSEPDQASLAARNTKEPGRDPRYERSLIEANLDPLAAIGADGKISDVNEAMIKVTGVPRVQLIGTDFATCFTDPRLARELVARVLAKGFAIDYPLTFRRPDEGGTEVVYNATVYKD